MPRKTLGTAGATPRTFVVLVVVLVLDTVSLLFLLPSRLRLNLQGAARSINGGRKESETKASCLQAQTNTIPHALHEQGRLPKPFVNLGMPKMGTSTLHDFFRCGYYRSSHWECGQGGRHDICSVCMQRAIRNSSLPLSSCGDFDAFAQIDNGVFYPQMEFLDEIHAESPNATFLLVFRNTSDWYRSLSNWYMSGWRKNLNEVIARVNITGLPPGKGKNLEEMTDWFCGHVQNVRNFVSRHPSHALVEVELADPSAGEQLGRIFGIREDCWGHSNKNPKLHNISNGRE